MNTTYLLILLSAVLILYIFRILNTKTLEDNSESVRLGSGNIESYKESLSELLTDLKQSKLEDQFLIIEAGDYYIQYIQAERTGEIYCEVIGDEYLKAKNIHVKDISKALVALGFVLPHQENGFIDGGVANYSKKYTGVDAKNLKIIEEMVYIFNSVFRLKSGTEIKYQKNI